MQAVQKRDISGYVETWRYGQTRMGLPLLAIREFGFAPSEKRYCRI